MSIYIDRYIFKKKATVKEINKQIDWKNQIYIYMKEKLFLMSLSLLIN